MIKQYSYGFQIDASQISLLANQIDGIIANPRAS